MKKKIALVVLASLAATIMFGCSSAPSSSSTSETAGATTTTTTTTAEATTTTSETTTTVKELLESDFEVQEYIYVPWYKKENTDCLLVIKNNSTESAYVKFNITAHDKNDNTIGAASTPTYFIGPGEETICYCIFEDVRGVDHVTRKMTISDGGTKEPEIGSLEAKTHVNKNNVVLTISNNGQNEATSIYAYVLFFDKNGKIVDYTITDEIYSLPAGDSTSLQLKTFVKFASLKVYFVDGRY